MADGDDEFGPVVLRGDDDGILQFVMPPSDAEAARIRDIQARLRGETAAYRRDVARRQRKT